MKQFALVDVSDREVWPREFYLTREEAVEARDKHEIHTRTGVIPGREAFDIIEVDRPNQPCRVCGGQSENAPDKYPGYPYCRSCHYTGSAAEDIRRDQLAYIHRRLEPFGVENVSVWHTGGGCFGLGITFPGWVYYCTDGEASLPSDEEYNPVRGGWGWLQASTEEAYDEQDYENTDILFEVEGWGPQGKSDRQLMNAVIKHRKGVLAAEK